LHTSGEWHSVESDGMITAECHSAEWGVMITPILNIFNKPEVFKLLLLFMTNAFFSYMFIKG